MTLLQIKPRSRRFGLVLGSAALAAMILAGCQTDGPVSTKHLAPLSPEMVSLIEKKGMAKESPILVRLFKEESELEVWKQDGNGQYALLKTYPICRWSGELGPKIKQGDRQAPEGFYNITPAQMNPNSSYYLSFNMGYPNAFDRAHGRTGAHLMVHGDCSSAGCYAMTDAQMGEIFALGRESFFGGQRSFQVQAYPFRMTPTNLARHRSNPHFAFWKNLKEGNDHFEVTRTEPKVDVCGKRYVFNASASSPFQPTGPCPAFEVPDEIETPVAAKRQRDEARFAEALARVTPAPVKVGNDGGMHPVFVSTLSPQQVQDEKGNVRWIVEAPKGAVPRINDAPQLEVASATTGSLTEAPAPAPATRTASTASAPRSGASAYNASPKAEPEGGSKIGQMFSNLFSFGSKSEEQEAQTAPTANTSTSIPMPRPAPRTIERNSTVAAAPAAAAPMPAAPAARPAETARSEPQPASRPAAAASLMTGAQPLVQSGTFDSRWSSFR